MKINKIKPFRQNGIFVEFEINGLIISAAQEGINNLPEKEMVEEVLKLLKPHIDMHFNKKIKYDLPSIEKWKKKKENIEIANNHIDYISEGKSKLIRVNLINSFNKKEDVTDKCVIEPQDKVNYDDATITLFITAKHKKFVANKTITFIKREGEQQNE
jgi:hypothetical protein